MAADALLTSTEVAELLRVHPKHLYRLLRRGLPGHRIGRGHWRFDRDEVLAWMRDDHEDASGQPAGERPSPATLELQLASGDPGRRYAVGRIGERWVGHPLTGEDRCADALFVEAGGERRVFARPCVPPERLADNLLVAGCASALAVILDRLDQDRSGRGHWLPVNSSTALRWLACGTVHVAGIHLADPTAGRDHPTIVREALAGQPAELVHLFRWRLGLVQRRDAAIRVHDVGDLAAPGLRLAAREPGSGAMQVLGRALDEAGVCLPADASAILPDHRSVGLAVALGAADVGVAIESVAIEHGLAFVPLVEESFDLVVPHARLRDGKIARLLDQLDHPLIRRELAALGPYDTGSTGHATAVR